MTGFCVTILRQMHLNFFLLPYKPVTIEIKESIIESSNSEKCLTVTIDRKLPSDDNITVLCHQTNQKLHAFSRATSFKSFDKKDFSKNHLLPQNSIIAH